jgi:hypothetical protein
LPLAPTDRAAPHQESYVPVKYLQEQRHEGAISEIARVKFPFPNEANPDMEALTNLPARSISVGQNLGVDLYPDIVVVRRPGQWLLLMAEVETADTVNDQTALTKWLPESVLGDLLLYVPAGLVAATKALLKKHGIKVKGIRTWRFRPVWGLDVTEA